MILLVADRLNAYDRFQFRIESGSDAAVTGDPETAADMLLDLGVRDPSRFVAHVRQWGSVEIVEPLSH